MTDSERIVFPDELAKVKADMADSAAPANKTSGGDSKDEDYYRMADSSRIVFPDELAEAKADAVDAAAAANKTSGGDSNKVEIPPKEVIEITMRNAIIVPSNCDMASNGLCYEVHKDEEFK